MNSVESFYKEIIELYPLVQDTDATQAYQLMQKANVLRATLDEMFINADKKMVVAKNHIDVIKSRESLKADPKNSTNGNRHALCSDAYKEAVNIYADAKSLADLYSRQIEFLKNVSFQMFSVWDNCKKVGERF